MQEYAVPSLRNLACAICVCCGACDLNVDFDLDLFPEPARFGEKRGALDNVTFYSDGCPQVFIFGPDPCPIEEWRLVPTSWIDIGVFEDGYQLFVEDTSVAQLERLAPGDAREPPATGEPRSRPAFVRLRGLGLGTTRVWAADESGARVDFIEVVIAAPSGFDFVEGAFDQLPIDIVRQEGNDQSDVELDQVWYMPAGRERFLLSIVVDGGIGTVPIEWTAHPDIPGVVLPDPGESDLFVSGFFEFPPGVYELRAQIPDVLEGPRVTVVSQRPFSTDRN